MRAGTLTPSDAGTITISGLIHVEREPLLRRRRRELRRRGAGACSAGGTARADDSPSSRRRRSCVSSGDSSTVWPPTRVVSLLARAAGRSAFDRNAARTATPRSSSGRTYLPSFDSCDRVHFPLAARELPPVAAVGVHRVEMRVAVGLGDEVEPRDRRRTNRAQPKHGTGDPRAVMQRVDQLERADRRRPCAASGS